MPRYPTDSAPAPLTPAQPAPSPLRSLSGSLARASQSRQGKAARLERTQKLNKYMPRLRGICIFHFVHGEALVPDHFPSCEYMREQSRGNYGDFRRSFNFTRFECCYCCGAPQDQQNNGECPAFHANLVFGKCGYNHILFRTAFCIWQSLTLRKEMIRDLDITVSISSQEDFSEWAQETRAAEGRYHNCCEAFLWFCARLERRYPMSFM